MKKVQINKTENDQTEVGIQIRTDTPIVPLENRVYINKNTKEMIANFNGEDVHLNSIARENDPINPSEKQLWVNTTEGALKWKFQGAVEEIDITGLKSGVDSRTTSGLLNTLNEAELNQYADITNQLPEYIIDSFNSISNEATLTNLKVDSSALKVIDNQTAGTYKSERRSPSFSNYAEGVSVLSVPSVKPSEITDTNDGNTTIVFAGDQRDILKVGQKLLLAELEDENKYFSLDADGKPYQFLIDSLSYDNVSDKTTVVVVNQGRDLTLGFDEIDLESKLRFQPLNIDIKAGANGLLGTMASLEVKEALSLDGINRIFGQDIKRDFNVVESQASVLKMAVNHSANRENWIVMLFIITKGALYGRWYSLYSNDGLKTINSFNWSTRANVIDNNATVDIEEFASSNVPYYSISNGDIHIHDDGRFAFSLAKENGTYWADYGYYGKLTNVTQAFIKPFNHSFGGYAGAQHFETSGRDYHKLATHFCFVTNHFMLLTELEDNENCYLFFNEVDFDNQLTYAKGCCYIGADYAETGIPGYLTTIEMEGTLMWFVLQQHTNNYLYAHKGEMIANEFTPETDVLPTTVARGTTGSNVITKYSAIGDTNGPGGNRGAVSQVFSQHLDDVTIVDVAWDKEEGRNVLLLLLCDYQDENVFIGSLDFGRTDGGAYHETNLSFSNVPTQGNFTLDFTDVDTSTTETISPVPFSASASQLQSVIEALTFVGAGNVEVTGDFTSGFDIKIKLRKEINVFLNTSSLDDGVDPVVLTVNNTESGREPTWLYVVANHVEENYDAGRGLYLRLNDTASAWNAFFPDYWNDKEYASIHDLYVTREQVMQVKGRSIYLHTTGRSQVNSQDTICPYLVKIPDYTQCLFNVMPYRVGTIGSHYLMPRHTVDQNAGYGFKVMSKAVVPSSPYSGVDTSTFYSDGKFPLRTIQLFGYKSWGVKAGATEFPNLRLGDPNRMGLVVKILGLDVNGKPDYTNIRATSFTVPFCKLANLSAGNNTITFPLRSTLRLNPNEEFIICVEWKDPTYMEEKFGKDSIYDVVPAIQLQMGTSGGQSWLDQAIEDQGELYTLENTTNLHYDLFDTFMGLTETFMDNGYIPEFRYNTVREDRDRQAMYTSIVKVPGEATKYQLGFALSGYTANVSAASNEEDMQSFCMDVDVSSNGDLPPIVGEHKIIGAENVDDENYDNTLRLAFVPSADPEFAERQAERTTNRDFFLNSSEVDSEGRPDYNYLKNTVKGNFMVSGHDPCQRIAEITGNNEGLVKDSDFKYGWALSIAGQSGVAFNRCTQSAFRFDERDFCIEFEFKPAPEDLDGSHNIIMGMGSFYYVSILYGKWHMYFSQGDNSGTVRVLTEEDIQDKYQRVRIKRDQIHGLKFFVNYTKDDENAWEELATTDGIYDMDVHGSFLSDGYKVGDYNNPYDYVYYGRYNNDTNYQIYGKLGYLKISNGSDSFKYSGINLKDTTVSTLRNMGDSFFGLDTVMGSSDTDPARYYKIHKAVFVKREGKNAKTITPDTLLRYGQNVEGGTKIATDITLEKVSDSDPTSLQGFAINFNKK